MFFVFIFCPHFSSSSRWIIWNILIYFIYAFIIGDTQIVNQVYKKLNYVIFIYYAHLLISNNLVFCSGEGSLFAFGFAVLRSDPRCVLMLVRQALCCWATPITPFLFFEIVLYYPSHGCPMIYLIISVFGKYLHYFSLTATTSNSLITISNYVNQFSIIVAIYLKQFKAEKTCLGSWF